MHLDKLNQDINVQKPCMYGAFVDYRKAYRGFLESYCASCLLHMSEVAKILRIYAA